MTSSRRRGVRGVAAVVGSLVSICTLGGCGGGSGSAVPHVIVGVADHVAGRSVTAALPTGRLTVTVGAPVAKVDEAEAKDYHQAGTAPSGTTYLPVHVGFDAFAGPWGGALASSPQEASLSIRVGSSSERLATPYLVEGGRGLDDNPDDMFYVAFPGRPTASQVAVQVGYDGQSETIPLDTGAASGPLAELGRLPTKQPEPVACPGRSWTPGRGSTAVDASVQCDVALVGQTPYWPGLGWAPSGRSWAVVRVADVAVASVRTAHGSYRVSTVHDATPVPPAANGSGLRAGPEGTDDTLQGTIITSVPTGRDTRVALAVAVSAELARGHGARVLHLTLRHTVRVPA